MEGFGKLSAKKYRSKPQLRWLIQQCEDPGKTGLFDYYDGDSSHLPKLERQTYKQWKSLVEFQRVAHPLRARRRTIVIQPLPYFPAPEGYPELEMEGNVLGCLVNFCRAFFMGMQVELADPINLAAHSQRLVSRVHGRTNRVQFLVDSVLKLLKSRRPHRAHSIVGVTLMDLYPSPEWNFVLGHASLTDGLGVFTFGRHFTDLSKMVVSSSQDEVGTQHVVGTQHGLQCSSRLRQLDHLWVLIRTITHELCHIFGMKHCYYFRCAMNESSSLREAADQPLFLCPVCLRKLQKALGFNLVDRYSGMKECCIELLDLLQADLEGKLKEKQEESNNTFKIGQQCESNEATSNPGPESQTDSVQQHYCEAASEQEEKETGVSNSLNVENRSKLEPKDVEKKETSDQHHESNSHNAEGIKRPELAEGGGENNFLVTELNPGKAECHTALWSKSNVLESDDDTKGSDGILCSHKKVYSSAEEHFHDSVKWLTKCLHQMELSTKTT